jgi:hypothetical protein
MLTAKTFGVKPEGITSWLEQWQPNNKSYKRSAPQVCEKSCIAYEWDDKAEKKSLNHTYLLAMHTTMHQPSIQW